MVHLPPRRALPPLTLAAILLAACAPSQESTPDNPLSSENATISAPVAANAANAAMPAPQSGPAPALAIEAEGLRLFNRTSGAATPMPFGTAQDQVMTALAIYGQPKTGTNTECGAGPLDYASWPDGLTVYFQKAAFAGWALDERAMGKHNTAIGIGPGSTRRDLSDAYTAVFTKTSIGTEFAAGKLYGVLNSATPDARITNMWAGVSCVFR